MDHGGRLARQLGKHQDPILDQTLKAVIGFTAWKKRERRNSDSSTTGVLVAHGQTDSLRLVPCHINSFNRAKSIDNWNTKTRRLEVSK